MAETTVLTPPEIKKEKKEGLFSKKNKKIFSDPFNDANPITVQVLGICSALAITVQVKPSLVMGISVTAVTAFSSLVISLIRNFIPSRIRIIAQLVIVAAMVILVDQVLKAFVYDVSKQLSVFVGLIITNCIVMGRLEAFSLGNKPLPSFIDGMANGLSYTVILLILGIVRELFGSGKILGFQLIPDAFYRLGYVNNGLMILPPMALICLGIIIWVQRSKNIKLIEKQ